MQASQALSSTSMRCISDNVQFSIMHNSIFPQSSSQLYGFGFNETVSENIPLQFEDGTLNAFEGSSFCMETTRSIHAQNSLISGVYSESPFFNYQSGLSSAVTIERLGCPSFVSNHFTNEATSPAYDSKQQQQRLANVKKGINAIPGSKKRPIEHVDKAIKRRPEFVAGNRASQAPDDHPWRTTKRMAMPVQEKTQMLEHPVIQKENTKDVQRLNKAPRRRSQKLADKITALQKLVSPYGKTDTASVLHEASVFIKSSFHAIRSASVEEEYEYPQSKVMGDRKSDLKSKGFCLVPVTLAKNIIKQDSFNFNNHYSTADIDLIPHNTTSTHF